MSSERERVEEWCRLFRVSHLNYKMNCLLSVLESDGEKTLTAVLKSLGLTQSVDLVKEALVRKKTHPDKSE